MKQLEIGELVRIGNFVYEVHAGKWANQSSWMVKKGKRKNWTGIRVMLKKLKVQDLDELAIRLIENERKFNKEEK